MWRSKFSNLLRSLCLQVKRRCAKRWSIYASRHRGWGPLYYLHSVICSYHEWPITARLTMESGPNDSDLSPFDSWPVRHKENLTFVEYLLCAVVSLPRPLFAKGRRPHGFLHAQVRYCHAADRGKARLPFLRVFRLKQRPGIVTGQFKEVGWYWVRSDEDPRACMWAESGEELNLNRAPWG